MINLGQRLTEFYESTNSHQRTRVATIVNSVPHWVGIQAAAATGNDVSAREALRNLKALFDERKAASPIVANMKLFQLGGALGLEKSRTFLELLDDAA